MPILDEFDEKIDNTARQLDELINKSSRITSVNDLLVAGNTHHQESNRLLQSLHDDLQKHSSSINDAIKELSQTTSVIREADPSRIIGVVQDEVKNIHDEQEKINDAVNNLQSKVEEIESRTKKSFEAIENTFTDHLTKTQNTVQKKINIATTLIVLNLLLAAGVAYMIKLSLN